jgi:hypothetical protein
MLTENSCMILSSYPFSYMNLWLKAQGNYSVTQINNLPTVTYAVQIVASWLGTTLAAVYPSWAIYGIASACCLFSTLCMIVWDIPTGLKYATPPYHNWCVMRDMTDISEDSSRGISSVYQVVSVQSCIQPSTVSSKKTLRNEPSSWYVFQPLPDLYIESNEYRAP